MSGAPLAAPAQSHVPRSIAFLIDAWRAATPRHFFYTALIGLVWTGVILTTVRNGFVTTWGPYVNAMLTMQLNGFGVLLGVLVADKASPPSLHRSWPYVIAVVVGVASGSSLLWLVSLRLLGISTAYGAGQSGGTEPFETFFYRHATHGFVIWGMTTFVYVRRRWAAHSIAALRSLQLERLTIEKRVLEMQLSAMQARVEPDFLHTTLGQVERLYEIDASAADRLLRDLIVYLRAAIPRYRDPGSTVAREIRLANAYLSISWMRSRDWLAADADGAKIAGRARMPPMVMLPLVNHALRQRGAPLRGDERFDVEIQVRNGALVVTIHDHACGFDPAGGNAAQVRRIHDWLTTMHGGSAKLTFAKTSRGTGAILEMPYEAVPVVTS